MTINELTKPTTGMIRKTCKHCGTEYMYVDGDFHGNIFYVCMLCATDHDTQGNLVSNRSRLDNGEDLRNAR